MKILLVSASSGSRGGGEFYFHGLATGLTELGHDVHLMLSDGSHMDEFAATMSECSRVERIPMTNTYHRKSRLLGAVCDHNGRQTAAKAFRDLAPDIVHINKQNLEDGLELMLAGRDCGLPTVATIHVTRSAKALGAVAGGIRDIVTRYTLNRCLIPLIGTSASCTVDLKNFLRNQNIPCYNAPNGAFAVDGDRAALRNEWDVRDEEIVLGVVARIEAQKNPLFVAPLMQSLPSNVRLVWVGDGSMRTELESELAAHAVQDRVHLMGWQPDARHMMAGFDVFVLPSLYEGFPFAILEAMSAGLPCVVSDVDGTRDAIDEAETGHLCGVNDLEGWTQALAALANDPDLRERLGGNARDRYEAEFSLVAMATRTIDVYKDVISGTQSAEEMSPGKAHS